MTADTIQKWARLWTWLKRLCIQATAAVFLVASIAFHGRVSRCITKSRGKQSSVGKTTDNER